MRRIIILAALSLAAAGPARGQAFLGAQTDAVTGAIQNQIRQAVRPLLRIRNAAGPVTGLAESPDGRVLAIVYNGTDLRIWDVENGVEIARYTSPDRITALRAGADDSRIALGTESGNILLLNAANGTPAASWRGHQGTVAAIDLSRDGAEVVSAGSDATLRLWDSQGRALASAAGQPGIAALAFAADGRRVVAGGTGGAFLWDAAARSAPVALAGAATGTFAVGFGAAGRIVALAGDGSIRFWDAGGRPSGSLRAAVPMRSAQLSADGRTAAVAETDARMAAIDLANGQVLRQFDGAAGGAGSVLVDPARRRLLSGGSDGIVHVWSLDTGASLVEIIATVGGWAALDGQGRFDGTPAGVADVEWLAARQVLPIDNFSDAYFEPGLVAEYMRNRASFVAPAPTAVPAGIYLPPTVAIAAPPGSYTAGTEIAVTITAVDQGGGIGAIRLFQNGKLVPPERRTGERRQGSHVIQTYRVALVAGANRLAAVAADTQQIDGERARTDLVAAGPATLPNLDIVAIGVDRYQDSRYDLDYSVPDAVSILHRLARAAPGVFTRAATYQLTDAGATRAKIIDTLTAVQRLPASDVLVVYLAGHGVMIGKEWYFLPQDVVFTKPGVERIGISATQLRDLLSRAGPQRILVMVDSCRSGGSVDPLAASLDRRVLRSVGRDTGVAILAGAGADQSAAEIPRLGHGAFTYVVLQGLAGKADTRHAGRVTADELLSYSTSALPGLTKSIANYVQVPVAWARGEDFMLTR